MKKVLSAVGLFIISGVFIGSGCGSPASSSAPVPSSQPTSVVITPPDSSTPTSTGPTFGSLSTSGQTTFAASCASCHGAQGQGITGPALIGPSSSLDKYTTALSLLSFISSAMPLSAPGSLTHQQYLEILSFLMVQNNFVSASNTFNESALAILILK
jgi:mono/diheme cytochrome c family protein